MDSLEHVVAPVVEEAFEWERDGSESKSRYGYQAIEIQELNMTCSFEARGTVLKAVPISESMQVPVGEHEDLDWSEMVISGNLNLPDRPSLRTVVAAPSNLSLVVSATTHGHSRYRQCAVLDVPAGGPASVTMAFKREDLRGMLELSASLVLSNDAEPEPGLANKAFTRVVTWPQLFVETTRVDPQPGRSMKIEWVDFGRDKGLFRLLKENDGDGGVVLSLELNSASAALQAVLDSTVNSGPKAKARRMLQSVIAMAVFTQLSVLAKEHAGEEEPSAFMRRLSASLARRGVRESEVYDALSFDGLGTIISRLQDNLQLNDVAAKLTADLTEVLEGEE